MSPVTLQNNGAAETFEFLVLHLITFPISGLIADVIDDKNGADGPVLESYTLGPVVNSKNENAPSTFAFKLKCVNNEVVGVGPPAGNSGEASTGVKVKIDLSTGKKANGTSEAGLSGVYYTTTLGAPVHIVQCVGDGVMNEAPHFKTWTGEKYDYHCECDLVALKNPNSSNRLGMDVHICTRPQGTEGSFTLKMQSSASGIVP